MSIFGLCLSGNPKYASRICTLLKTNFKSLSIYIRLGCPYGFLVVGDCLNTRAALRARKSYCRVCTSAILIYVVVAINGTANADCVVHSFSTARLDTLVTSNSNSKAVLSDIHTQTLKLQVRKSSMYEQADEHTRSIPEAWREKMRE